MQKALQLPVVLIFSSLSSVFQKRTIKRFLSKISPFVTQEPIGQDRACFLGYTGKYFGGDMFIVTQDGCDSRYGMCFRKKLVMPELSEHGYVINIFHVFQCFS